MVRYGDFRRSTPVRFRSRETRQRGECTLGVSRRFPRAPASAGGAAGKGASIEHRQFGRCGTRPALRVRSARQRANPSRQQTASPGCVPCTPRTRSSIARIGGVAYEPGAAYNVNCQSRLDRFSGAKAMSTTNRRFAAPEALTDETKVLGVPVKEWNKAFVGNFEKSLGVVKARAELVKQVAQVGQVMTKRRHIAANSNQEAAPEEHTQKRTAGVSR
jgi:hypothetical protein